MQPVQSPAAFEAFHKAQTEFKAAVKDSINPHFKSRFADFGSVYDAVASALHSNGLFVTQPIQVTTFGTLVETTVRYKDGTVVENSQCPVICKAEKDPQAMGSAITYARRYSLASIFCVVTDDDDAEAATARTAPAQKQGVAVIAFEKLISTSLSADNINLTKDQIMASTSLTEEERTGLKQKLTTKATALKLTYDKTINGFK